MTDLETTDPSADVQVSWGADPVYHFLNVDCKARDRAYKQPHIIPLKLAKWFGYKKLRCVGIISDNNSYQTF